MGRIRSAIVESPIDSGEVTRWLGAPECGAEVLFLGIVRANNLGHKVQAVSYDCMVPLAEKTLAKIAREALEIVGSEGAVCVIHRIGTLPVGEASVIIGTASPHRSESYKASRHVIEEIKKRLPIWKKEHYEDGESEWLEGHALCTKSHDAKSHGSDSCGGSVEPDGKR